MGIPMAGAFTVSIFQQPIFLEHERARRRTRARPVESAKRNAPAVLAHAGGSLLTLLGDAPSKRRYWSSCTSADGATCTGTPVTL